MGRHDRKPKDQKARRYLDQGTVVLNTITRRLNVHNTIYCWRIFNFPKLQRNVIHFQEFHNNEVKIVLKLIKTKKTLYLCLRSNQLVHKTAQFYLMCETDHTCINVEAVEICKGLYVGQFTNELFDRPELQYLQKGMLFISFRYISDKVVDANEAMFEGVDILSDVDELCCDLKHMYLDSMYPDFEIRLKDYVFSVHKFILASRCQFFRQYFARNYKAREFMVDTFPGILHEFLLFVYCGELMDMDLACMAEVMHLACYFVVPCLIEECTQYYKNRVNASNFDEFHTVVQRKKTEPFLVLLEEVKKELFKS